MIFKNRVQRDIDEFNAFRGAGARRNKEHPVETGTTANSIAASGQRAGTDEDLLNLVIKDVQKKARGTEETPESVVSSDATWEGTLRTKGSISIGGRISGEIEAGETVVVMAGANIQANVCARRVIVSGTLEGYITCRERLVVEKSGRLGGKVDTATLVIEEGAVVQSEIHMPPASASQSS